MRGHRATSSWLLSIAIGIVWCDNAPAQDPYRVTQFLAPDATQSHIRTLSQADDGSCVVGINVSAIGMSSDIIARLRADRSVHWTKGTNARVVDAGHDTNGDVVLLTRWAFSEHLIRTDSLGNLLWALELHDTTLNLTQFTKLILDDNGDAIVAHQSALDVEVFRIRPNGSLVWSRRFSIQEYSSGGPNTPFMALDRGHGPGDASALYVGWNYPGVLPDAGGTLVARIEVDGSLGWAKDFHGGPYTVSHGHSMASTSDGRLLMAGYKLPWPFCLVIADSTGAVMEGVGFVIDDQVQYDEVDHGITVLDDGSIVTLFGGPYSSNVPWTVSTWDATWTEIWTGSPYVYSTGLNGQGLCHDVQGDGSFVASAFVFEHATLVEGELYSDPSAWPCGATGTVHSTTSLDLGAFEFPCELLPGPVPIPVEPEFTTASLDLQVDCSTLPVSGPSGHAMSLRAFPVPASDRITVDLPFRATERIELCMFDAVGKAVSAPADVALDGSVECSLAGLEPGCYSLCVRSSGFSGTCRVVKE